MARGNPQPDLAEKRLFTVWDTINEARARYGAKYAEELAAAAQQAAQGALELRRLMASPPTAAEPKAPAASNAPAPVAAQLTKAQIAEREKLRRAQRRARFEKLAAGWVGSIKTNVWMLESIADFKGGERAPELLAYCANQHAATELFLAVHGPAGKAYLNGPTAWDWAQKMAKAERERNPAMSAEQALARVFDREKSLYAIYRNEEARS